MSRTGTKNKKGLTGIKALSLDNTNTTNTNGLSKQVQDNKRTNESQGTSCKSSVPSNLHPLLTGEFWYDPLDYEWPQLPKFPAYDPGEQEDLFPMDFFGEVVDYDE